MNEEEDVYEFGDPAAQDEQDGTGAVDDEQGDGAELAH